MINLLILFAETIFPRYSLPFIIIVICSSSIYLKVSRKDKEPIDLVNVSRHNRNAEREDLGWRMKIDDSLLPMR